MTITRQKKEEILSNLNESLKKVQFAAFVNFHGLDVSGATELRRNLRNIGAGYIVSKKTLLKRALDDLGLSGEAPVLEGEIGLAFSETDAIAPAQELKKFAKTSKIKILGGIFESNFITSEKVTMLASIPPREILLGQFVNVINSPIQGVVAALSGVTRNLVGVLDQIKNNRS